MLIDMERDITFICTERFVMLMLHEEVLNTRICKEKYNTYCLFFAYCHTNIYQSLEGEKMEKTMCITKKDILLLEYHGKQVCIATAHRQFWVVFSLVQLAQG